MSTTVMIVDDALFMRNVLRNTLKGHGYDVVAEAASGIEAMKYLHDHRPDIITLDIILPDANGLDLLDEILQAQPEAKVVVCSAIGQEAVIKKAMERGARGFIQKPFTPEKIVETLKNLAA